MPSPNEVPDDDVIEAINLTVMCQSLHVLPRAGGLLDQDAYHVWLIEQVTAAQAERAELEQAKKNQPKGPPVSRHR